jgi:NADH dehydrogenase ubiquinone Fe-S protein 4
MVARIFRPAKTAMQSGRAKTHRWVLEFEPERPKEIEPLMGYTSSDDMRSQVRLQFESKEEAIDYATRNGIAYRVFEAHDRVRPSIAYSDNFKRDRTQPWTH